MLNGRRERLLMAQYKMKPQKVVSVITAMWFLWQCSDALIRKEVGILTLIHTGLELWQAYARKLKVMIVSGSDNPPCDSSWEKKKRG